MENGVNGIYSRYLGNDNGGKPKSKYIDKIIGLDDNQLYDECKNMIWLSAYANNNHRSDYHWMVDVCYDVCVERDKKDIYSKAYDYHVGDC